MPKDRFSIAIPAMWPCFFFFFFFFLEREREREKNLSTSLWYCRSDFYDTPSANADPDVILTF